MAEQQKIEDGMAPPTDDHQKKIVEQNKADADPSINKPPPLTVKNAIKYIKGLQHPLGEYFGDLLELSDTQLVKLQKQSFQSPDEEFKAYMTEWIEGEKERDEEEEEPRWRRLIWALDMVDEDAQADQIRAFAEPHKDPTFTVENLAAVYDKAPLLEEDWGNLWSEWGMSLPASTFTEIHDKYNSVKEKNRAAAAYLVKIDPNSSWVEVAKDLNDFGQLEALDEARKYLPKKEASLTVENLSEVMKDIKGDWREVWGHNGIGIPPMVMSAIEEKTENASKEEVTKACAESYVRYNPEASWKNVANGLLEQGEKEALEKVQKYLKES